MVERRMTDSRQEPQASTAGTAAPFTLAGIRRGIVQSLPLAASVLVYGIIFGLLAKTASMTITEAMLMSALVFSGSAQMVAVNGMPGGALPTGAALLAITVTIVLLNARYLLYGAALRPWMGQSPALQAYGTLAVLGDGNWILSMKAEQAGERDAGFVFGSGASMFVPWLCGTFIGMLAGGVAANPKALGLDFMLIAFSAALGIGLLKGRNDVAILAVAIAAAVGAERLIGPGYAVIAAAAAGGLTGWSRYRAGNTP
jgi:predicted branched-subunit amino acid permease